MFNNLGIFSNNLIRVLRPGINIRRRPIVTARSQVLEGTMTVTNRSLSLLQVPQYVI